MKNRRSIVITLFLSVFLFSFFSSISPHSGTVDFEERTAGGFYEPIQVVEIERKGNILFPIFNSPSDGYSSAEIKKIRGIEIIYQETYPDIKIRIPSMTFMLSPRAHIGPLHTLWQWVWMKVLHPSIFSARFSAVILFLFLLIIFYSLVFELTKSTVYASLSILFLTLSPNLQGIFQKAYSVYTLFTYISFLSLILCIVKRKGGLIVIAVLSSIMLHSHILLGGALSIALLVSYIITYTFPRISFKDFALFLIIIFTFVSFHIFIYILSPATAWNVFYPQNFSIKFHFSLLFTTVKNLISTLFVPFIETGEPIFKENALRITWRVFTLLSRIPFFVGIIWGIKERKRKEVKFLLLISLIFSSFGVIRFTRPHHYLPLVFLLLLEFLITSPKKIRITLLILSSVAMFFSILLFLFFSPFFAPYKLKFHQKIANFLVKNHIYHPYSMTGPFGYELLTDGKVRVVDFTPFLLKHPDRLKDVVLLAEGKYVLLREVSQKSRVYVRLNEFKIIASALSFEIDVIKRFPYGKEEAFCLIKVKRKKVF